MFMYAKNTANKTEFLLTADQAWSHFSQALQSFSLSLRKEIDQLSSPVADFTSGAGKSWFFLLFYATQIWVGKVLVAERLAV